MRWARFAVLLLIATLLQAGLVNTITLWRSKPDLLLILLCFFAIHRDGRDAIISSFAIGFAADLIGSSMGLGILSFGLAGTGFSYVSRYIRIRSMPVQGIAIFVLGLAVALLAHLLRLLTSEPAGQGLLAVFLMVPLYSAVLGPFLFLPTAWWMHIRINRRRRR